MLHHHINLTDIKAFVWVAKLGSFTKAAEALASSRSHVSKQVSTLEQQMASTLLLRTTRTLRLTKHGETFFQECEQALTQIEQAVRATQDEVEQRKGKIRLNCVGGFLGEKLIGKLVSEFMQHYPDIEISLDFSSHRIDLIQDDFDLAFRMGPLPDAGFVARKLMELEIALVASPNYLAQHPPLNHPKELEHYRCLTGSVTRWRFQNANSLEQLELHLTGSLECKNGYVLTQNALAGNGIARLPTIYCQQELEQQKLIKVLPEWNPPSVPFSMIYHKDKFQPKRLRTFIDFCLKRLKSQ